MARDVFSHHGRGNCLLLFRHRVSSVHVRGSSMQESRVACLLVCFLVCLLSCLLAHQHQVGDVREQVRSLEEGGPIGSWQAPTRCAARASTPARAAPLLRIKQQWQQHAVGQELRSKQESMHANVVRTNLWGMSSESRCRVGPCHGRSQSGRVHCSTAGRTVSPTDSARHRRDGSYRCVQSARGLLRARKKTGKR